MYEKIIDLDRRGLNKDKDNQFTSEEYIKCGKFCYRYIHNWAKRPQDLYGKRFVCITCDNNGYIYATTNAQKYPVAVFDRNGNFVKYLTLDIELGNIHGIYVDSKMDIWITSTSCHVAVKIDQIGRIIKVLGQYKHPSNTGINETCAETRLRWHTIKRLGEPFNGPTRIVEANEGDLFASDGYGNVAVHCFDNKGNYINSWGGIGTDLGK